MIATLKHLTTGNMLQLDMYDEDKSIYEYVGQSPHSWLSSAAHLKRAADLVAVELTEILKAMPYGSPPYQDLALFYSYMPLAGLSLESLTKGIYVGRHPGVVRPKDFNLKTHNLPYLLNEVGPASLAESELVERLYVFVVWAGKYPISLKATDSTHPSFRTTHDFDVINSLFERLVLVLHTEHPNPTMHFS